MKKIFLPIVLFCLLSTVLAPLAVKAADSGLVTCNPTCDTTNGTCSNMCTICNFFQMLAKIYDFIVKDIAVPLAIVAIIIGGIFILISAGNPNLAGTGKKILYAAFIGLALVFCSY
jgi:hypothetical protein